MERRIVLFIGLNATGHLNSLMGIADRLRDEYNYRTIFLFSETINPLLFKKNGYELYITVKNSLNELQLINLTEGDAIKQQVVTLSEISHGTEMNRAVDEMHESLRMQNPVDAWVDINTNKTGFRHVRDKHVDDDASVDFAIKEIRPDLIVLDTWYIFPCILKIKQIPWVYLCSANPIAFANSKLPNNIKIPYYSGTKLGRNKLERQKLRDLAPDKWQQILTSWRHDYDRLRHALPMDRERFGRYYVEQGFEPLEPGSSGYSSPFLNIYQYPKEIDYDQEDDLFEYPPRWLRCDIFLRKQNVVVEPEKEFRWFQRLQTALQEKQEIIYFSFGTLASGNLELMRRYINMLKTDNKRLYVVSKGFKGDAIELDSSNMIGDNYIPQTFILQRANLAITHGGNNTFVECFYYGVPMIVLPYFVDQFDNAQRIEDLKLGRRLNIHTCQKEELFDAVEQVLSDKENLLRLKKIQKNMQERDDMKKVALLLKKLTDEKHLDESFVQDCNNKHYSELKL